MPEGIPLPRSPWKRLVSSTNTYDAITAVLTLPLAFAAVAKLVTEGWPWLLYAIPVIAVLTTFIKLWLNDQKERGEVRVNALEGALHTLHRMLLDADTVPVGADPKLRLTIHSPSKDEKELIQLLDYVGDQRKKKTAGRRTQSNCGVIGLAFGSKEMATGKRENPDRESYVRELISKWHFTEEAARVLDASTMAWLAIPLKDGKNKVVAVLFADSVDANFFTEMRVLVALSATNGIAEFVRLRLS